ncbi:leukotriene B4 receptor 1-like [Pygocentrus nattereri]|uniref:G-protein coupled receptors family 1 profile domain-containing protein n=1 Tax=Pygocentrus nattereri TaxID=42514 RepID=A0A3B4CVH1_PYGNA|nr:leukotriene B4 receptor 1-like [Pygocentrus nattereri]
MQYGNSSNSSTPLSPETLVASSVLGLCFALGVPGNIAVLVLLSGWLKGGSFTPRLMLSLAISDLMTLLPLPLWIYALLHDWVFGLGLCKFFSYVVYWSLYSSVLCVTLLSVQRYIQVLHPQKWAKIRARGQNGLVSGIWILSGVFACYSLVQRHVKLEKDGRLYCRAHYQNNTERVATLLLETILMFVVPFPLLVYFYVRLHCSVSQSAFFNSHRMTRLVTRTVATFFFFWVSLHINNIMLIVALLLKNDHLLRFAEAGDDIAGALTFINSCVNPFIYAFSARAIRQRATGTESV